MTDNKLLVNYRLLRTVARYHYLVF